MIQKNQLIRLLQNIKFRAGRVNVLLNGGSAEEIHAAVSKFNESLSEYAEFHEQQFQNTSAKRGAENRSRT